MPEDDCVDLSQSPGNSPGIGQLVSQHCVVHIPICVPLSPLSAAFWDSISFLRINPTHACLLQVQRSAYSMGRLHHGQSDSTSSLRTGALTLVPTARLLPGGRGKVLTKPVTFNSQSIGAGGGGGGGGGTERRTQVTRSPLADVSVTDLTTARQPPARRGSIGCVLAKATGNRLEALVARPLPSPQLRTTAAVVATITAISGGVKGDPADGSGSHRWATDVDKAAVKPPRAAQNQGELTRALSRDHAQAKSSGGCNIVHHASTGCILDEPSCHSSIGSSGIVVAAGSMGGGGGVSSQSAIFPSARASLPLLPSIVGGIVSRSIRHLAQSPHDHRPSIEPVDHAAT